MKICSVDSCDNKHYAKGYCRKHYKQIYKYGEIKHGKYELNEIIICENHAEILLYDRKCNIIGRTLIDLEDIDKVKNIKWWKNERGYVNSKNIMLHKLIMDCPKNKVVDHINHDPLDNRKSNLRICSQNENRFNSRIRKDNTTGYPGIMFIKKSNKYRAKITKNGITHNLGYFNTLEEAIKVRKEAEEKYFGEFRCKE